MRPSVVILARAVMAVQRANIACDYSLEHPQNSLLQRCQKLLETRERFGRTLQHPSRTHSDVPTAPKSLPALLLVKPRLPFSAGQRSDTMYTARGTLSVIRNKKDTSVPFVTDKEAFCSTPSRVAILSNPVIQLHAHVRRDCLRFMPLNAYLVYAAAYSTPKAGNIRCRTLPPTDALFLKVRLVSQFILFVHLPLSCIVATLR